MNTLPKIDQEFFDDQDKMRIYAIAVCRGWRHWQETECPRPIMGMRGQHHGHHRLGESKAGKVKLLRT